MKNFINVASTEEEQVDQIKKWIKENTISIIFGVVIGLGAIFGWDFYENYQTEQNAQARTNYLAVVDGGRDITTISDSSSYKAQAQMTKAATLVKEGNVDEAVTLLKSVQSDTILKDVANLKLAKLYMQQQNFTEALAVLENNKLDSSNHLRGDIYLAQGKTDLAIETYTQARNSTANPEIQAIIGIKINNIK